MLLRVSLVLLLSGSFLSEPDGVKQNLTCDVGGRCVASNPVQTSSKYCIIGAGPAGIQMGHFMNRAGRDYLVFERGHQAGRFFNKYPVHRRLNSYNRRFTRSSHGEFRLRHDWHTLLEQDEVPRFGNWTEDFWPMADVYVRYLHAFQKEQQEAGHMRYCHHVVAIHKIQDAVGDLQYELTIRVMEPCTAATGWDGISKLELGSKEIVHLCQVLIMADGMWKPTPAQGDGDWMLGSELALGYDELRSFRDKEFEGKSVLILGMGNAAFETADAVRNYASDTVIFGRSPAHLLQDTRYVGGVRAKRTQIFDSSELKSLEAVVEPPREYPSNKIPPTKWALVPCGHARAFSGWPDADIDRSRTNGFRGKPPLCIFERDPATDLVLLGWADKNYWQLKRAKQLFGKKLKIGEAPHWMKVFYETWSFDFSWMDFSSPDQQHLRSRVGDEEKRWNVMLIKYKYLKRPLTEEQRDLLAEVTALTKGLQKRAYELDKSFDVVIRCWGWQYDSSPFDQGNVSILRADVKGRLEMYPRISSIHESVSAKNIFFIGANAHGLDRDRYKASGGFVHGYRYTTRTVFRTIEERYEHAQRPGVFIYPWPLKTKNREYKHAIDFSELLTVPMWKHLLSRILFSAASYEMIGGALVDGIIFNKTNKSCLYIEEIPEDVFHAMGSQHQRLTFGFYAGDGQKTPQLLMRIPEFAAQAHPFHAVVEFFPKGSVSDPMRRNFKWLDQVDRAPPDHPSAAWPDQRTSKRFHFKADRLTDFSTSAQVPLLDNFLRDIERAVTSGKAMAREYHEIYD